MSSYRAQYYNPAIPAWVDIGSKMERPQIAFEVDIVALHITEYKGQSIRVYPNVGETLNLANGREFRYYLDDTVDIFYITGNVINYKVGLKNGEIEFDIMPESERVKELSIPESMSADTYRGRLEEAAPAGYTIVAMDSEVDSELDEQPNWSVKVTYPSGTFADLIFDTLLIMNGLSPAFRFSCAIFNKEVRFYSDAFTTELNPDKLQDILIDSTLDEITFYDSDQINDNLRGTGSIIPPLVKPRTGIYYKSENKIITTEELNFLANVEYNSVNYGIITAYEENEGIFTYTATKLTFVGS